MDLRKVKKLIELLEGSNLDEIEIREGEESIRLSRGVPVMPHAAPMGQPLAVAESHSREPASLAVGVNETSAPQVTSLVGGHQVTSPMVGTYFGASEPDAAPYVSVGTQVNAGDTLCVIEAMKIFNQIESDTSGTVVHVQKGNGDAVEYGELLFVIQ